MADAQRQWCANATVADDAPHVAMPSLSDVACARRSRSRVEAVTGW